MARHARRSVIVERAHASDVATLTIANLLQRKKAGAAAVASVPSDICDWIESNFRLASALHSVPMGEPPPFMHLYLHQKAILRFALKRNARGRFPFTTLLYGTVKKSGKSAIAGAVARWFAETQTQFGEIYAVGNNADQARDRSFKEVSDSIKVTPGFMPGRDILPGRWRVLTNTLRNVQTNTTIRALAVNARGEAGGHPTLSIWTELWGFEHEDAIRFWEELTPIPTQPDSLRWVETYAGYDGESNLLHELYERAMAAHQLTNHEMAEAVCRDVDGERYEDFLHAFVETGGDPAAKVPLYVDYEGGLFAYWDEGEKARRMPWQQGEDGEIYYRQQEAQLSPRAFRRLHTNEWVGAESAAIPIEWWDECYDADLAPVRPGKQGEPLVLGVDAASSGDCFAVVAASRAPKDQKMPAIRMTKVWTPADFEDGRINFQTAEDFIRLVCRTYNVKQIAYDPYQLEDMMQRLQRERVAWCEPFPQGADRLESDRAFYDRVRERTLVHLFDPAASPAAEMRVHITNANKKVQKEEDSKLRFIKKSANRKIDLLVAASMACYRVMYLNLARRTPVEADPPAEN